jgi:hypothetical protein
VGTPPGRLTAVGPTIPWWVRWPAGRPGPKPGSVHYSASNGHAHPIRHYLAGCPACQRRARDNKRRQRPGRPPGNPTNRRDNRGRFIAP